MGLATFKNNNSTMSHVFEHYSMVKRSSTIRKNNMSVSLNGNSLCCFDSKNGFRNLCANIVTHKWFDWIILLFICVSTILLAMESPMNDPRSKQTKILAKLDLLMTMIFVVEMLLKIVTFGFLMNGP